MSGVMELLDEANKLLKSWMFINKPDRDQKELSVKIDAIAQLLIAYQPNDPLPEWFNTALQFGLGVMFDRTVVVNKKPKQKAEKILQECQRINPTVVSAQVEYEIRSLFAVELWSHGLVTNWSSVIENSPTILIYLGNDRCFPTFIEQFHNTLNNLSFNAFPLHPSLEQQQFHAFARLFLQMLQSLPKTIRHHVWGSIEKSECLTHIEGILQRFLHLLTKKESPRDLKLLIGMGISLLITLSPYNKEASAVFFKILENVGKDKEVYLGNLPIDLQPSTNITDLDLEFASISLINGLLLSSMNKAVLLQPLQGKSDVSFLAYVFPTVCQLARSRYSYNGFQLLDLWYQTYLTYGFLERGQIKNFRQGQGQGEPCNLCQSQTSSNKEPNISVDRNIEVCDRLFSKGGNIVTETLQLIWTNWDNPVKGVPEFLAKIFTCVLKCSDIETKGGHQDDGLLLLVKDKIMRTPWNIRGKQRLLSAFLELGYSQELIAEYPEIPSQLAQCLSTSFLASLASEVYRHFMDGLKKEVSTADDRRERWRSTWMQDMVAALTSNNQLLRQNMSQQWISITLKILPEVLCALQTCLHDLLNDPKKKKHRASYLFAWVAVMKAARNQNLLAKLEEEPLREVLYHCDDDLRSDAFTLLCFSSKKSGPVSSLEIQLLYECLPLNLNIDHAPFRPSLIFGVKCVLIRLRDSSLALLKGLEKKRSREDANTSRETLKQNIGFVDWLWKLCMKSIFPGASFQRLITILDLVECIFTTFTYSKQSSRKQFTPVTESVTKLQKFAEDHGMMEFYSPSNVKALLSCTMEETVEIQEISCRLLLTYFPGRLHLDHFTDEATASHILSHGLAMCRKPKGQHSASGANLCDFVFRSYAVGLNWRFSYCNQIIKVEAPTEDTSVADGAIQFLELLIEMVQESIKQAETDVLKAAVCNPGHGYVHAMRLCISSHANTMRVNGWQWQPVIGKIIAIVTSILNNVLCLLGVNSENEGTSPSFAQMGTAILSTIQQSESGEEEGVVLSDEYQHILTWCWLSIKECSLLLGNLPHVLGSGLGQGVLTFDEAKHIGDMLIKTMTNCRHRGAIEACNAGCTKLMTSLLMDNFYLWNQLPGQYLKTLLSGLTSTDALASVTRRAAGLPLIVQSIVTSETKLKQSKMFDETMQTLLHIAKQPYKESDQTMDIPQVTAMHIMESLFRDAALNYRCPPYVSEAVILTVSSFTSPTWAIRNAALLVFGALLLRMFGQKTMDRFSFSSTTTAEEFFSHYPDLLPFLLSQLEEVKCAQERGRLLHPAVFPVLAILSRLAPSPHQELAESNQFRTLALALLASPVYKVRDFAAITSAVFISEEKRPEFLKDLVEGLPENWTKKTIGANLFHGRLLLVQKLVQIIVQRNTLESDIVLALQGKAWIASPDNPCFLLRSLYMQILGLLPHYEKEIVEHEKEILDGVTQPTHLQVGKEQVQRALSKHLLRSESAEVIAACLRSGQQEVREECLNCLLQMKLEEHGSDAFWNQILDNLFEMVLTETWHTLLKPCMELILDIQSDGAQLMSTKTSQVAVHLKAIYTQVQVTEVSGLALAVAGIFFIGDGLQETSRSYHEDWCQSALTFSEPTQTETTRLQAARAIVLGGAAILESIQKKSDEENITCAIRLFDATTLLLQDESSKVRQEITRLVSGLPHQGKLLQYQSLQFNSSMLVLLQYFADHFSHSPSFLLHVLGKLTSLSTTDDLFESKEYNGMRITSLFEQEEFNIFAEKVPFYGLLCDMFEEMVKKLDTVPQRVTESLKMIGVSLLESMKKAIEYLEPELKDQPIFNSMLNIKVYLRCSSFIQLSRILSLVLSRSSTGEITLMKDLEEASKHIASFLVLGNRCH